MGYGQLKKWIWWWQYIEHIWYTFANVLAVRCKPIESISFLIGYINDAVISGFSFIDCDDTLSVIGNWWSFFLSVCRAMLAGKTKYENILRHIKLLLIYFWSTVSIWGYLSILWRHRSLVRHRQQALWKSCTLILRSLIIHIKIIYGRKTFCILSVWAPVIWSNSDY